MRATAYGLVAAKRCLLRNGSPVVLELHAASANEHARWQVLLMHRFKNIETAGADGRMVFEEGIMMCRRACGQMNDVGRRMCCDDVPHKRCSLRRRRAACRHTGQRPHTLCRGHGVLVQGRTHPVRSPRTPTPSLGDNFDGWQGEDEFGTPCKRCFFALKELFFEMPGQNQVVVRLHCA